MKVTKVGKLSTKKNGQDFFFQEMLMARKATIIALKYKSQRQVK